MKTAIITAVAVVATATLGIQAQSMSSSSSASMKPVIVSGCVQRDSAGGASSFKLTDVAAPRAGTSAPSPSASSTTSSPSSSATSLLDEYTLQADSSVNLAQHVNHKVEITGTIAGNAASTTTPGSSAKAASASVGGPSLKVTSVRMIASSCQ